MNTWITISSWYYMIAMIVLCVFSIKAYRKTLKKIFLLFLVISLPAAADTLYRNIDIYLLTKHMTSISRILTGKFSSERALGVSGAIQMQEEKSKLWTEYLNKNKEIEKKYSETITKQKKNTWLKDLWQNIVRSLSYILFPIAGIIICLQEIKSSNKQFQLIGRTER